MDVSDAKRLKALEDENAKLKNLLADQAGSCGACRPSDTELRGRLRALANERRRFGYRRLFILLRRGGELSGINRIYRFYREERLTVRKR